MTLNNAAKHYTEWLKSASKEMIDGIAPESETDIKILEIVYGFTRRGFLESRTAKGGAMQNER